MKKVLHYVEKYSVNYAYIHKKLSDILAARGGSVAVSLTVCGQKGYGEVYGYI